MADKLLTLRKGLIDGCNLATVKGLLDDLLDAGILNYGEVELINEENRLCSDKVRSLVDTVRKKGNRSSQFLIQKVSERDHALSLELGITTKLPMPVQEQNASASSQADTRDGITLCSEEEFKRITADIQKIYPIGDKNVRTRLALIICNEMFEDHKFGARRGAEFDVKGMENLLTGFGYKVQVKQNLTVEEMRNAMKVFSQEKDHNTSDSTFLVFMSHGLRDRICGTDTRLVKNGTSKAEVPNTSLHIDEIFNTFNNVNCRALENKPKVIIIQACRGNESGQVLLSDGPFSLPDAEEVILANDGNRKVLRECDFACFCASTPGLD
ncbi:caspase-1-A-like [Gastrophryne carolinensis]